MRVAYAVALVVLILAAAACGGSDNPAPAANAGSAGGELRIAAAADLKYALEEVIAAFGKDYPAVKASPTFGSSGNFSTQLASGAPFDLFLSADIQYPRTLVEAGVAEPGTLFEYAVGRIVLWVPNDSKLDVTRGGDVLRDPALRKLAIANPAHAPYGRAAEAAMRDLKCYEDMEGKLVLGENIAQAAQFVASGAADAGVIALSLAISPQMKDKGRYWEIPLKHYAPILQGGVIMKQARNAEAARAFLDFLIGPRGRAILKQNGFYMPDGE